MSFIFLNHCMIGFFVVLGVSTLSKTVGFLMSPAFAFSSARFNRGHLVTSGLLLCTLRTLVLVEALVLLSFFHCLSNSRLPLASFAEDPDSFDTQLNSHSVAA